MSGVGVGRRSVWSGVAAAVLLAGSAGAQVQTAEPMAAGAQLSFEVATIKPSDPTDPHHRFSIDGHRLLLENQTVKIMIQMAYGLHPRQVVNVPEWAQNERFDVEGVPDVEGRPNVKQFQGMVRKLLADRFGLKAHTEKQEMPRYSLTVVKSGLKMTPSKAAPDALPNENGNGDKSTMTYTMTNVSVEDLAQTLGSDLDRPVVDETGLKGKYDLRVQWSRGDGETESSLPGFFTAIQEQLGLKMEPTKGEVEVLVIDHVERPSGN